MQDDDSRGEELGDAVQAPGVAKMLDTPLDRRVQLRMRHDVRWQGAGRVVWLYSNAGGVIEVVDVKVGRRFVAVLAVYIHRRVVLVPGEGVRKLKG